VKRGYHVATTKPKKGELPLASGLIGGKAKSIHGQLTVKYIDYKFVKVNFWRKLHSGLPDVEFLIEDTDLPEILELLNEANKKIDESWLTKISTEKADK